VHLGVAAVMSVHLEPVDLSLIKHTRIREGLRNALYV